MMKIDRRSFLALGLGAAAGTALTPLPWKLTDDISIWTQNWRWLPVPADGDVTMEIGACTLCPGGCGISVRKVGDRIVKIEGLPGHPVNDGGICALGISGTQLLYGGSRIKSPMKRSGERGQNKWSPISWDDAIAEVTAQIKTLVEAGKQESLACITGSDRGTVPLLFKRLLAVLGSPNFMPTSSMADSYSTVIRKMQGLSGSVDAGFDIENAGFILSFGSGIVEGWGSPLRMIRTANDLKAKKVSMVQVEQRLSNTAAFTQALVAVKPGTETDLALGMAAVIVAENLHNASAAGGSSSGFAEFAAMLKQQFGTDAVSAKTGLKSSAIVELARKFADPANRSLAICGRGRGSSPGSTREFMAVHALNSLVGRVNAQGGVYAVTAPDYIDWAKDASMTAAITGKTRIDEAGTGAFVHTDSLLNRLPAKILAQGDSPVGLLLVSEANPVYTLAGTKQVMEAFKKVPYIVSFSTTMDETTALADIVLPNHSYLERYQDVPVRAGLVKPLINLAKPVAAPQYDTQNVGDVVIKIAKALESPVADAFPWENYEDCLAKTLGDKWEPMKEKGFWADDSFVPSTSATFAFPAQFPDAPALAGDEKNMALVLLPKESMRLWGGAVADLPFGLKTVPDTELKGNAIVVEVNPKTGAALGLADGKEAVLTTASVSATVKVTFFEGIMEGVVAIPKGLGHTGSEKYLADKGVNTGELIAPVEDPVSGLDAAFGTRASLRRA
jgi:anaerobic selenocysteine-containing dehydrogenase